MIWIVSHAVERVFVIETITAQEPSAWRTALLLAAVPAIGRRQLPGIL